MKKPPAKRFSPVKSVVVLIGLATLTLGTLAYTRSNRNDPIGVTKLLARVLPKARAAQLPDNAGLTAEGLQQIAALVAEKESRTPAQRKLASALLQAIKESRGQQLADGVPLERANVNADASGLVPVDITASVNDSLLANIQQLGGEIIFPSVEYKAIRARVPLSAVEAIAGYPEVTFIRTATPATTHRMRDASADVRSNDRSNPADAVARPAPLDSPTAFAAGQSRRLTFAERAAKVRAQLVSYLTTRAGTATPFVGKVTSQGDKAHQADTAKSQYGFSGEGIRIGVMSDSFNYLGGLAADIAGGDLPGPGNPFGNTTPVTVVQDLPAPNGIIAGSDEGRAMVQIVHDIAPKAQLFFASAFISEAGFATNIKRLRDAPNNCDIVIDDVSYSDEGVFQDSIVAQAVNYVTASGGLYFSSAGNEGSVQRNTASAWEGDFNDAGSTFVVPGNSKSGTVHNFGTLAAPVNGNILLSSSGFVYSLDWSDPLGASNNDYDLFVVNSTGTTVKAASTNIQNGLIDPHEEIGASAFTRATGDRLVIFKSSTAAVRALNLNANGGRLTVFTTGNTHGHSCAADAYGVAAAAATAANTSSGVFTTASRAETFSSDGPRRIFYNADGSPVTPGNILFATNGGTVRQKPDITAADNVTTSGNNLGSGLTQFSGTSAAAPHAGAIAALLKSAKPSLTPAQIRTILTAAANTIDIENPGVDATTGYGILNANAIVAAAMVQQADLTIGTTTATEGTPSNSNTIIESGEYANIVVQLTNPSLNAATGVNATVTTSTPGVTIVQGSASYGTIPVGGNASNTGTPFVIAISPNFPCGSPISLLVTATMTNGSPVASTSTVTVGGALAPLVPTISGTLSLTPPTGAGFTSVGGTKTGTLARNGIQSTCASPKPAPLSGTGFSATTGGRYAAFTFTNPSVNSRCVSVSATSSSANNLQTAAFDNNGFVPATSLSAGTNYVADSGTRATTMAYSFVVPGSQSFTIVIYDATTGGTAGATNYTLTVSLSPCASAPVCSPVVINNAVIASGSIGIPYTQSFNASGGSGSYMFSLAGNLPAGLSFAGNTLAGTPTQAGSFAVTITATDPTCPAGSANYTLVIAGTIPASVTVTAGNSQTAVPGTAFATALQATVRDGNSNPLGGVNVMFAAPASGASGTFPGGVSTVIVVTNGSGVATAPTLTANTIQGGYAVTATVNGVPTPATFNLNNTCPGAFVVTTTADSGAGSLRNMIQIACPGATITFDPSVTGTITLATGELTINKALTITGPGAGVLAVSGNHFSRVFNLAPGTGNTVNLSGLTIKDGSTKADGTDFYGGGGVLILSGTAGLTDCVITGNSATNSGNPDGGGVDNEGGAVTINRCSITGNTITNNIASNGAFYFGGGVFSEGTSMTITNSTIAGNSCGPYGNGGGLAFFTTTTLTNSTVYGNSASNGGNVFRAGGTLTFKNSIIAGGTQTGTGGVGVDINGASGLSSADYNLIQTTAGGTISGTTTHNITGVSPNLLALGSYGGPTPTLLPAPNSPAINVGDTALTSGTDQRGLPRFIGGQADIGAVETNYALAATGGTPQSTIINTSFASPLKATVTESGNPINGITVTYTAPGAGASGLFGGSATGTATTNASGIASSPAFTANGTTGSYSVTGGIGTAIPTVAYSLTNTGPAASIAATAGTPQNTLAGQAFATPLQATVKDSNGTPVFGVTVTFTVVANNGTSGTFPGNATSATATTNISGQATAPTLTANSTGGTFTVNATVSGVGSPAAFNLTVCAIVCPSNIVKSTDANQCNAVVSYNTPTTAAGCGTVMCSPASGSTFPKGTSTVTCTLNPGNVSCSFTVTVNDTQPPSITCPANITQSNDLNQCGAVVNYMAPSASDNCPGVGTPSCSPPSGSFFPKGTTTVSCSVSDSSSNSKMCSFTVTINDTQPPAITCSTNITAVVPAQCPLNTTGIAVGFTAPVATDNCPGVSAVCVPPSGSVFPIGTTTVTCTATDTSNNKTSCSFRVKVFDVGIQDDTNPNTVLLFNSYTGEYVLCFNGQKYTGTGAVSKHGCAITLTESAARRVNITVDMSTKKGSGSIQIPTGTVLCTITDKDMANDACNCAYPN